jgi:hypothetical protein
VVDCSCFDVVVVVIAVVVDRVFVVVVVRSVPLTVKH